MKKLKGAVRQAESMVHSLDTFLRCTKVRLERLQKGLKTIAAKTYFPLLSDDILAIIFEFASSGDVQGKPDYRSPFENLARLAQVSRYCFETSASLEIRR